MFIFEVSCFGCRVRKHEETTCSPHELLSTSSTNLFCTSGTRSSGAVGTKNIQQPQECSKINLTKEALSPQADSSKEGPSKSMTMTLGLEV